MENKKIDRVVLNLSMPQAHALLEWITNSTYAPTEEVLKIQGRIAKTITKRKEGMH